MNRKTLMLEEEKRKKKKRIDNDFSVYPEPVMANWGQDVRRVACRSAKVGKSFGSRRLPEDVVEWNTGDEDEDVAAVGENVRAEVDVEGEMAPPVGTAIDRVDVSLSEAVRPPPALLGEGGWCEETVLSDLDRSWRRWADERWTALGDLLPTDGADIFKGGGGGGGCGWSTLGTGSSFSLETENLRGEMFKLATLLVTYCCNVLKKLISVGWIAKRCSWFLASSHEMWWADGILEKSSSVSIHALMGGGKENWGLRSAPEWRRQLTDWSGSIHLSFLPPTRGRTEEAAAERGGKGRDAGNVHACA